MHVSVPDVADQQHCEHMNHLLCKIVLKPEGLFNSHFVKIYGIFKLIIRLLIFYIWLILFFKTPLLSKNKSGPKFK